jgi:zinc protease
VKARVGVALLLAATSCAAVEFAPRKSRPLDRAALPGAIDSSAAPIASVMPSGSAGSPRVPIVPVEERLSNGVRVILLEQHAHPLVAVGLVLQRGSVEAPPGVFSLFVDAMTFGGSADVGWNAFRRDLFDYAVIQTTTVLRESSMTSVQFIAPLLRDVVGMVAPSYATPEFDADAIEPLIDQHKRRAAQSRDEPAARARRALYALLYPPGHPYAADVADSEHPLEGVTRDAIRDLYACVGADDVAVVAAGDVTMASLRPHLEAALKPLKPAARARKAVPEFAPPSSAHVVLLDHPHDSQAQIAIGFPGVTFDDPDWAPLFLVAKIVDDGMRGSLRLAHGSTYHTNVDFRMMRQKAPIIFSTAVDVMLADEAITDTLGVLSKLDAQLAKPGELDRLRNELFGNSFEYDTVDAALSALTPIASLGLPVDHYAKLQAAITALSADDLVRVARKYLDPARMQLVVLGDGLRLKGELETLKLGTIEERKVAH